MGMWGYVVGVVELGSVRGPIVHKPPVFVNGDSNSLDAPPLWKADSAKILPRERGIRSSGR